LPQSEAAGIAGYSRELLDATAAQINMRPRKTLGVRCPLDVYRECLLNASLQSNTIH